MPTGLSSNLYTMDDLRSDYKRGLVLGVSFCLFAMPKLDQSSLDEEAVIDTPDSAESFDPIGELALNRITDALTEISSHQ